MNKIFPFLLVLLFPLCCLAQSWTVNKGRNGQIYLYNPSTWQYKTIAHHIKGKFVGINYINEKTCMALFVYKGDTIRKTFTMPFVVHKNENKFQIIHKDSTSYTYSVNHSDLVIHSDFNTGFLKIYQDTNLVLEYKPFPAEKYVHHKLYKYMLPKSISSIPKDIDEQQQTLLVLQRHLPNEYGNTSMGLETAIKEISLKYGTVLFKKEKVQNPSYAPDKKFILFFNKDGDKAFYRDRKNNQIFKDKKSIAAFWL